MLSMSRMRMSQDVRSDTPQRFAHSRSGRQSTKHSR
jgi:hypothetical protein